MTSNCKWLVQYGLEGWMIPHRPEEGVQDLLQIAPGKKQGAELSDLHVALDNTNNTADHLGDQDARIQGAALNRLLRDWIGKRHGGKTLCLSTCLRILIALIHTEWKNA